MKKNYILALLCMLFLGAFKAKSQDPDYFPIAVWLQNPANAQYYKNHGINLYIGIHDGLDSTKMSHLTSVGMPVICEQNPYALTQLSNPLIKAWMQQDEPDNAQPLPGGGWGPCVPPDTIKARYEAMKLNDPSRPVYLNLGQAVSFTDWIGRGSCTGNTAMYPEYIEGCDMVSFDIYPVNNPFPQITNNLWYVPKGLDSLKVWSGGDKPYFAWIETTKISRESPRKPTVAEVRTQVWMALIHGAKAIGYFCHTIDPFDEIALLNDPVMIAGVKVINSEVTALAPLLNSPNTTGFATVSSSNANVPIDFMTKHGGNEDYIFASAMRGQSTTATFTVASGTVAEVIGENRRIAIKNGQFKDNFAGYATHLYKIITTGETTLLTTQVPETTGTDMAYELGVKLFATDFGMISAIRFYKMPGDTGTHVGKIWSASGEVEDSVVFTSETASGWQVAQLSTPYKVYPYTHVIVSVNSSTNYAYTEYGLATQIVNGPLRSVTHQNGIFGAPGQFPTNSYHSSNYFRDVVFDRPGTEDITVFTVQAPQTYGVDGPYEMGMKFTAKETGPVKAIRYYKTAGETGSHTGRLWNAAGVQVASASFTNETASGWQEVALNTPYMISAYEEYTVSVNSNSEYAYTAGELATSIVNGPLSTIAGANGVYGTPGQYPVSHFQGANYYRDIVYERGVGDTVPPAAPSGLNADSITQTGFVLHWTAATDNVGATSYDVYKDGLYYGTSKTTQLQIAGLEAAFTYSMTVQAKDGEGNISPLSLPQQVSTLQWPAGTYSVLTTETPALTDTDGPYEMGMKFTSTLPGKITAIRFHKPAGDDGTHTGRIWDAGGNELASVVFTGETASGWQTAQLGTPVTIAENTTYVVSVNSVSGYGASPAGFVNKVSNGPLSSIAGGNGVFGTVGNYPQSSYGNTNYFRDIVFEYEEESALLNGEQSVLKVTAEKDASFSIYPNPVSGDEFYVKLGKTGKRVNVEVLDLSGKVVYRKNGLEGTPVLTVRTPLQSGVYIVKVAVGNKIFSGKILKLKN